MRSRCGSTCARSTSSGSKHDPPAKRDIPMTVSAATTNSETPSRLERLLPLLAADPANLALLADAAERALAERKPEVAADLLERYAAIQPLPPRETNLAGLAALQMQQFDRA